MSVLPGGLPPKPRPDKVVELSSWQALALEEAVLDYWAPGGNPRDVAGAAELVKLIQNARVVRVSIPACKEVK